MPSAVLVRTPGPVLPRPQRVTRGDAIAEISRRGRRGRSGDVVVSVRRTDAAAARGCVVVGKRAGGAVVRNRQRRRLQHALADLLPQLPGGTELVVRGGPDVVGLTAKELTAALADATRRALQQTKATR